MIIKMFAALRSKTEFAVAAMFVSKDFLWYFIL